jgi:two-component system, chemotaxis family, sensor kinase CheA
MIPFVDKFKHEVREYCERLESGLLLLEQDPENDQVIGEIFRIMHSMKGSGGMFGFDLISDVTHDLESLYDLFRTKKQKIDSEVISFTLNSIDGLLNLMVENPEKQHHILAEKLKRETLQQIARLTHTEYIPDNLHLANEVIPSEVNEKTYLFHLFQAKTF